MEEDEPFDLGWLAGYKDECAENPYPKGSNEAEEWNKGYEQGSRDC